MQTIAPSQIDEIFYALNSQIEVAGGESVSLVVIGGTALTALDPSWNELLTASRWVLTQDVSLTFSMLLKDFLARQGYKDVAEKL